MNYINKISFIAIICLTMSCQKDSTLQPENEGFKTPILESEQISFLYQQNICSGQQSNTIPVQTVNMANQRNHDFAISNGGWLVAMSDIEILCKSVNGTGTPVANNTLFGQLSNVILNGAIHDPDVYYDPIVDKFYITAMAFTTSANGGWSPYLVVLRSKTNMPTASHIDWEYNLLSHPNSAFDFSRITSNSTHVLISSKYGNSMQNTGLKPILFTLPKMFTVSNVAITKVPTVLPANVEYLMPVIPATAVDFNRTDFHLVSMNLNCPNGCNGINVSRLEANGSLITFSTTLPTRYYNNNNLIRGTNNASFTLFTNRPWSAIRKDNIIQFVTHVLDRPIMSTGNQPKIYHGVYNTTTNQLISYNSILPASTNEECLYPSISFLGCPTNPTDNTVAINYLTRINATNYWKARVTNRTLTLLSSPANSFISLGAYTGAQRKYNEQATVFISGQIRPQGMTNQQGYISKLVATL